MTPILFLKDWNEHPSAIIQHNTKNTTFLRLSALYRDMGIKNHAFILQLHNPELLNIDPRSNNLSIEEMALIAMECADNPFYFYREVAVSPDGTDDMIIRYRAHHGSIALNWLF